MITQTTVNLILFAILSNMRWTEREHLLKNLEIHYQHGSSGDGAFDSKVRQSFNKELENAQAIISNPIILLTGR